MHVDAVKPGRDRGIGPPVGLDPGDHGVPGGALMAAYDDSAPTAGPAKAGHGRGSW